MTTALAENLIHFVRYLRARGVPVVPRTAQDLMAAALAVGLADRDDAYHAFRSVTISRREHISVFDEAFELFFGNGFPQHEDGLEVQPDDVVWMAVGVSGSSAEDDDLEEASDQVGASGGERLAERDFAELDTAQLEEVRRLLARMIWQPAKTRSRRWAPDGGGRRPDLRRTMRRLVGHEGDLIPLEMTDRRFRRRPLLVIADVSGSMDRYVEMFLSFVHAARGRLGRVEAFVFSTRLTRITRELRRREPSEALRAVAEVVEDWSGGTRIGESLRTFNLLWSRRVTRGGPIVLIISDGWDCGEPEVLRSEMSRLSRSVHRVIWLNPLAGRPGYAPETRGMQAALPFVDDFLPAARLRDLSEVVDLLESVPPRRRSIA